MKRTDSWDPCNLFFSAISSLFSGLYLLIHLSLGSLGGPAVKNPPGRGHGFDPWSGKTSPAAEQLHL